MIRFRFCRGSDSSSSPPSVSELLERVDVGDGRELRLLGAEADVAVALVDEEVGGRAVHELVAGLGDLLPLRRGNALSVHVAGDRHLLEEDVLDPLLVDQLADLANLVETGRVVPRDVQRRIRVRHRAFRQNFLDLRRTLLDDCHLGDSFFDARQGLIWAV
jgi:hypothetical protein